ncbi:MAG TPA: hypothetical protein PKW06_11020, partial [Cyclobacteriaceae bacterium]|nr:hypothetical protein [Cyclobacteriaceae bacterium]
VGFWGMVTISWSPFHLKTFESYSASLFLASMKAEFFALCTVGAFSSLVWRAGVVKIVHRRHQTDTDINRNDEPPYQGTQRNICGQPDDD